jgi:gliding motility-associated-like protein
MLRPAGAFTPFEGSQNPRWEFENLDHYVDMFAVHVIVFNRGGFPVYEDKDYRGIINSGEGWDGKRNGIDLPIGTYYWAIRIVPRAGVTSPVREMTGTVVIIR